MKRIVLVVMDGARTDTGEFTAYEMQKASSSCINPDVIDVIFPPQAQIFFLHQGFILMDGGLQQSQRVQNITGALGQTPVTKNDFLLLDSSWSTVPESVLKTFPGAIDATNDWFWKLVLTNKAVFRMVLEESMPEWNPVHQLYTRSELLTLLSNKDTYRQFQERFNWKQNGDTIFMKNPNATRGEGNTEVAYHADVDPKTLVENIDSELILIEEAKGYCRKGNEGAAASDTKVYETCRLCLFHQSHNTHSTTQAMISHTITHRTFDSHSAKRTKKEQTERINDVSKYQTFFENMNKINRLELISKTLEKDDLTEGQHLLCQQVLHYYLNKFYIPYAIRPSDDDYFKDEPLAELQALLQFLHRYIETAGKSILNEASTTASSTSFIKKLALLACKIQYLPLVEVLIGYYGSIDAIQERFLSQPASNFYDLNYLLRTNDDFDVVAEDSNEELEDLQISSGYATP